DLLAAHAAADEVVAEDQPDTLLLRHETTQIDRPEHQTEQSHHRQAVVALDAQQLAVGQIRRRADKSRQHLAVLADVWLQLGEYRRVEGQVVVRRDDQVGVEILWHQLRLFRRTLARVERGDAHDRAPKRTDAESPTPSGWG